MPNDESRYLDYLPAIFRGELAGPFLLAFERLLTGVGDAQRPGLEEILEGIVHPVDGKVLGGIERYFDPGPGGSDAERAPAEFLDWLAGWVALTLREDWIEEERRRILARIVPSYQKRGTKEGLQEVLAAYTDQPPESIEILELNTPMQVGVHATIGTDTVLGDGPPHYFRIRMRISVTGPGDLARRERVARAIIDQEKPAHTYYDLEFDVRTLQIAVRSTVGVDTVLGTVT